MRVCVVIQRTFADILMWCIAGFDVQGLNYAQMHVFAMDPVFLYPQMLPECRFIVEDKLERKVRVCFSEAEDK